MMTSGERLSTADFAAPKRQPQANTEQMVATSDTQAVERRPEDRAERSPLFPGSQAEEFRQRWTNIQSGFVDEPRRSVEQADTLVAGVMQRLAQVFSDERSRLEQQWDRGDETDTEELRQALQRYRSFFDRLLTM
jgi:hypothetical protein